MKTVGQSTVTDGSKLSEYIELVDGIYLNQIMLEMWVILSSSRCPGLHKELELAKWGHSNLKPDLCAKAPILKKKKL